ncbi:MAG TPA: class I adenylate-forming enzyme family protein [Rhodopila sp.]|uniref:class I adenylate-forming enzyme family protein n=1 Tax=Rhodopila sp. TaxID=2480087 RepID=UPI002C87952B|nr:class I adenylate-forming enzyme family protein [Rhodopila sp.]HVY14235.1 class I adenylate-forming enzyme family protein [Rhodopila sp.]
MRFNSSIVTHRFDVPVLATLLQHAREAPDAPAFLLDEILITYGDFAGTVTRLASFAAAQGIRPGMLIGIRIHDRLLHVAVVFACEACGAGTASLTDADAQTWTEGFAACDMLFADGTTPPHPRRIDLSPETIRRVTGARGTGARGTGADPARPPNLACPPRAAARVIKSSGTTGAPKPIALGPAAMAAILRHRCDLIARFGPEVAVFLCLYEPDFDRALTYVRAMLMLRRIVAFSAARLKGLTLPWFTLATPGSIRPVIVAAESLPKARFVDINGAAVDPRTWDLVATLAEAVVVNYGMNEATGISWVGRDGVGTLCDGVGTLCDGVEARIDRDPSLSTRQRKAGLISVRAPTLAQGYLGHRDLTSRHFTKGWFRTGDLGFQPGPGQLVVLGRADDLLNLGGVKLAPNPLEAEICAACDVSAAVLLTVPDSDGVERLCVILETPDPEDSAGLGNRVAEVVGRYADQFQVMVRTVLPRNDGGKIRRDVLRTELTRQRGSAGRRSMSCLVGTGLIVGAESAK